MERRSWQPEDIRLQNAYNGAVVLFDLMQVRKAAGKELEFLNKIRTDGQVSFYSKVHDCWSLNNKSAALFTEARRVIRNALDWISFEIHKCIEPDPVVLENKCIADLALSDVITPPQQPSGRQVETTPLEGGSDGEECSKQVLKQSSKALILYHDFDEVLEDEPCSP